MKLCRFDGGRYGVVRDDQVYDVTVQIAPLLPAPGSVRGDGLMHALDAIVGKLAKADLGKPATSVAAATFLSPIVNPTKIVNAPVNYELHIAEAKADPGISFNRPTLDIGTAGLFLKATSALVGPGEGVAVRFPDRRTDHEIEIGVVIGKQCSDVAEERALEMIGGYAIALDMTVRGTEDRSFRKSIDTYAVLGPWMITTDEMPDPDDVNLKLSVNGTLRQNSNSKHMIYNFRKLIGWASRWYTLYPGDIIMSGTPEGVGPVGDGDVMHCEIDHIGSMDVKVRNAPAMSGDSKARDTSKA
jgi:2-keto-4-pentenoate hydratase/2-oxohepta-3-ene-1,7-dioic acid hydratase in catechol pathway